ncbi:glycerate 2-kinase [Sulfodiicoccus acidiphilus]|nr:glycerate 2-kinase [Sulfodiicoccus acidiphilus]
MEERLWSTLPKLQKAADPYQALSRLVKVKDGILEVMGNEHRLGRTKVISVGKAAYPMARWALDYVKPESCLAVIPSGVDVSLDRARVIHGSHPNPDELSLRAGEEVMKEVASGDYDTLLFMISGGASAMIEVPLIELSELREVNRVLVTSGLSITEINSVRKHLSKIKGGKLAKLSKGKIVNLVVSDVPGNDLSTIGSGPTVPDDSTFLDALKVAERVGIQGRALEVLRRGVNGELEETPKKLDTVSYLVLDNMTVLKEIAPLFQNPLILTSELQGEVSEVSKVIASIFKSCLSYGMPLSRPFSLILGGEPEVTVRGEGGIGGRNSELSLHLLKLLKRYSFALLAYATDGIDGNSEFAGAILSSSLVIDHIDEYINNHDTYTPLAKAGVVIKTGYTHTNVNNVYVLTTA